jgi:hypothetical protein
VRENAGRFVANAKIAPPAGQAQYKVNSATSPTLPERSFSFYRNLVRRSAIHPIESIPADIANGRCGTSGRVPAAEAERPLSVQELVLHSAVRAARLQDHRRRGVISAGYRRALFTILPKLNRQHSPKLGSSGSQPGHRRNFRSRASGTRVAVVPSAPRQTVGRQRPLRRCSSASFLLRTCGGSADNGRRAGLRHDSHRVPCIYSIATFHAAARKGASGAIDAASGNTLSRLKADVAEPITLVRLVGGSLSLRPGR